MKRLIFYLKLISQLGIRPLWLFSLYRLGLATGHYRRLDARMHADARTAGAFRPVLPVPERGQLAEDIGRIARSRMKREADAVVGGRFRAFGDQLAPLQFSPNKHLRHWVDYERDASLLDSLSIPFGDIKFLWEPARFGWAHELGRMFHVSGREEYAVAFWKRFEQFDRANPAYLGPQWMNGQEVAIRLMALLWSAHIFAPARASTRRRLEQLSRTIALHAARIPPTLVYARAQNNNHLVTEAAALFLAGAALDHETWRELGWKWLNRALVSQISPYGQYIQHSSNYHRHMLQSALLADAGRRALGRPWPSRTQTALSRASHWLFSMLDPVSGRVPNLGANDGSLILPLSTADYGDFRPTVQAAARAFLRTSLPPGEWDDLSLWLGLPASAHTADSSAYASDHVRAQDSWAYLRASSWKSRLGHVDQTHVDLWWRGTNVATDAGTYLYNAAPPWDNPLVSSQVHNCLTVDRREPMTRGGRFLTLDWFPARSRHILSVEAPIRHQVRASHAGFATMGIRYERSLSLLESGVWRVSDDAHFIRRGRHTLRLHWLLIDGAWQLQQRGQELRLRIRLPSGPFRLTVVAGGAVDSPMRVSLVRAGKLLRGNGSPQPWEGWISPTYGRKFPALSLTAELDAYADCFFTTEFQLPS